jgi:hypothetical protein
MHDDIVVFEQVEGLPRGHLSDPLCQGEVPRRLIAPNATHMRDIELIDSESSAAAGDSQHGP